jgi:hypothetical protein
MPVSYERFKKKAPGLTKEKYPIALFSRKKFYTENANFPHYFSGSNWFSVSLWHNISCYYFNIQLF